MFPCPTPSLRCILVVFSFYFWCVLCRNVFPIPCLVLLLYPLSKSKDCLHLKERIKKSRLFSVSAKDNPYTFSFLESVYLPKEHTLTFANVYLLPCCLFYHLFCSVSIIFLLKTLHPNAHVINYRNPSLSYNMLTLGSQH